MAKAGQDRVVQPNDEVRLSGFESKDDDKIIQYEWVQVSGSPTAVLEVCEFSHHASGSVVELLVRQELCMVLTS